MVKVTKEKSCDLYHLRSATNKIIVCYYQSARKDVYYASFQRQQAKGVV